MTDLTTAMIAAPESQVAWHALYTRHQHEKTVDRILTHKGFQSFLPVRRELSQWKDRAKRIDRPLFPCYLFVQAVKSDWLSILTTPGVQMIVPCGDKPAVIPAEEIEAIQRLVENGEFVELHPYLKTGDRVRVKSGPLAGVEGFLIRKKSVFRLVVCIEILGKAASAEIDAAFVERADNRSWNHADYRVACGVGR